MKLAEKLRFLADRAEDGKPFLIDDGNYVFDKNTLRIGGGSSIFAINEIKFADLKLKPTWEFTEDEKAILRNLDDRYEWLVRNSRGDLEIYESKPDKEHGVWLEHPYKDLDLYNHIFPTIQWSDDEPCEFRRYIR